MILVTALAAGLIASAVGIQQLTARQAKALTRRTYDERSAFYSRFVDLRSSRMKAGIFDNTFWDEAVAFVRKPTHSWAHNNLDSMRSTYDLDGLWIFDPSFKCIYSTQGDQTKGVDIQPVLKTALKHIAGNGPFYHFYIQTSSGVLEIRGASIHGSGDQPHTGPAFGYMFGGRLWDKDYLGALEGITGAHVTIAKPGPANNLAHEMVFSQPFKGWDGHQVARLQFVTSDPVTTLIDSSTRQFLVVLISLSAILLLFVAACLHLWVTRPVTTLCNVLSCGDVSPLARIPTDGSEMGRLSSLVAEFYEQKSIIRQSNEQLAAQVDERNQQLNRQRETLAKLEESEALHIASVEAIQEGYLIRDVDGTILACNPSAERILRSHAADILGRNQSVQPWKFFREDGSPFPVDDLPSRQAIRTGESVRNVVCGVGLETEPFVWISISAAPLYHVGEQQPHAAVITFSDITERKAHDAERERALLDAKDQADQDPLTGLQNHRAFHKRLEDQTICAKRESGQFAIVFLDLDNFKFFNDAYGHAVGDGVLIQVADRLRNSKNSYSSLSRFGGDEFTLIVTDLEGQTTEEIEARLREDLGGLSYQPEGHESAIPITISLGSSIFPLDGNDRHELLRVADERLYRAKTGGSGDSEAHKIRSMMGSRIQGFSMLDELVTAVDNKDRYTRQHSEDVMTYSTAIARELGIGEDEIHTIGVAALLHDVGKIGTPDAILRKPGKLTDEEFEVMKQHPQMGAIIVSAVPGLEGTLDAVRHHHERWDGNGYPFGLRGEETPLIARIMAVADAYSAMTTDRPYRKGMATSSARDILKAGIGTQWDETCVNAFLNAQDAGSIDDTKPDASATPPPDDHDIELWAA